MADQEALLEGREAIVYIFNRLLLKMTYMRQNMRQNRRTNRIILFKRRAV